MRKRKNLMERPGKMHPKSIFEKGVHDCHKGWRYLILGYFFYSYPILELTIYYYNEYEYKIL